MACRTIRRTVNSFIAVLIALFSFQASAWREGNGGDGIRVQNKLYLLDLVESGIESIAETSAVLTDSFFEAEVSRWATQGGHAVPKALLVSKLVEVQRKNTLLAHLMLMSLQKLEWSWINVPIKDIRDQAMWELRLQ